MKQKAIIADLDGTWVHMGDRDPYDASKCDELDKPNWPVIETVNRFLLSGYKVLFVSARPEEHREPTVRQIRQYVVEADNGWSLYMRKNRDYRDDSIVKKELYEDFIEPNWDVLFVMDDRMKVVRTWRELGLTCFQVNPGPQRECVSCAKGGTYPMSCALCGDTGVHYW